MKEKKMLINHLTMIQLLQNKIKENQMKNKKFIIIKEWLFKKMLKRIRLWIQDLIIHSLRKILQKHCKKK